LLTIEEGKLQRDCNACSGALDAQLCLHQVDEWRNIGAALYCTIVQQQASYAA